MKCLIIGGQITLTVGNRDQHGRTRSLRREKTERKDREASLKSWRSKTESQKTTIITAVSRRRKDKSRLRRDDLSERERQLLSWRI